MMFLKKALSLPLLTGLAFISVLAGQSVICSAGADPPSAAPVSDNTSPTANSRDLTTVQNGGNLPPLRFKKEDFVPIPDMVPMPLDEPQPLQKKPKQVNVPAASGVKPVARIHKAHAAPTVPAQPSESAANHDSPGVIIVDEALNAAQRKTAVAPKPALPLLPINQPLETLSPAAGADAPPPAASLIPLPDLPPEPLPVVEQPAQTPIVKAAPRAPSAAAAQAGAPLIALPAADSVSTPPKSIKIPASASAPPTPPASATAPPLDTSPPLPAPSATQAVVPVEAPAPEASPDSEPASLPPVTKKRRLAVARKHKAPESPPEPAVAADVAAPQAAPLLPANVPSYAVQHWSGPDAVEATAINTLPPDLMPPVPVASPIAQAAPQVESPAAAPPPAEASAGKSPAPVEAADKTEPKPTLSEESKKIARNLHPVSPKSHKTDRPVLVEHARDLKSLDQPDQLADSIVSHDVSGVKIEIKQPRINFSYELEKAYMALVGGQSDVAIATYKKVLDNDPNNKNALFGLATAYHRAGQIDLARPVYAKLLAVDPANTDGLNNFLVLLSDEAPEEALVELEKLAQNNPQYSALPAQIAVIYQKLGQYDKAGDYMFRAIDMSPENLTYRYNFAIMLDKQHKYEEAAKLYHQIVQAYQRGETIPGNIQKIQQRLTFISSNRPS